MEKNLKKNTYIRSFSLCYTPDTNKHCKSTIFQKKKNKTALDCSPWH